MRLFSIIIKSSGVKNMKTIEIDTKCGKIKGIEKENTTEWLGIKYATAKRWEYPQTVKKWVKCDKNSRCFLYCFARDLPGDKNGAWHSSDLLYAFSTLDKNWRPFENIDYTISNQIAKSFIAFAKTGNPNCNAIPKWESGSKKIMTFCEDTKSKAWMTKKLIKNTIHGGFEV